MFVSCFLEFARDQTEMDQAQIYDLFGRSCNATDLRYVVDFIIWSLANNRSFPALDHVVTFEVWESISGTDADSHIRVILVPKSYDLGYCRYTNLNFYNFSLELVLNRDTSEPILECLVK